MKNTIILIDESFDIAKIKSYNRKSTFISLDISSHINLEDLGIEHEKIEDYLNKIECKKIDDFCFDLSFNKINSDLTFQLFEYDGFHLGELFRQDFFLFLLKTMKYFVGISNILKKISSTEIICSELISNFIANLDIDKKISLSIIDKQVKINIDKFTFPIFLGKKVINVNIPMSEVQKAARLLHKISNILYNFHFNEKKDERKVLSYCLI